MFTSFWYNHFAHERKVISFWSWQKVIYFSQLLAEFLWIPNNVCIFIGHSFFLKESEHEGDGDPSKSRKRKSSEARGISPIEWDREESEAEKSDNEGGSDHDSGEEDEAKGTGIHHSLAQFNPFTP